LGGSGVRVAHFVVDAFAAVTAVGGGTAWATGLKSDRFPAEMLRGAQFGSYVIPGLILAGIVGGGIRGTSEISSCAQFREQDTSAQPLDQPHLRLLAHRGGGAKLYGVLSSHS
jgi:hypothetical protein